MLTLPDNVVVKVNLGFLVSVLHTVQLCSSLLALRGAQCMFDACERVCLCVCVMGGVIYV